MARRYVFTAKRRAALRKAQLVSARKRKRINKMSRKKKAALVGAGVLGVALLSKEIKVSNTYMYAMKRYKTIHNYRDLPKPNREYERRHMKHRQRAASFGSGRSTFAIRKKRQAYNRNIRKGRIEKLGFSKYAYRMTRNTIQSDPLVEFGRNAIKRRQFKRTTFRSIRGL